MAASLRILVIEDRPSVGAILTAAFEHEGCTTTLARSCADALRLVHTWRPDLILLDCRVDGDLLGGLSDDPASRGVPIVAVAAQTRKLPRGYEKRLARVFGEPFYPAEVVAAAMEQLQSPARLGG